MKKNRLFCVLSILAAFVLSSCDFLPKPSSRNSQPAIESSEISTSSIESAHEHVWSEWETKREATCVQFGSKERYCTICGQVDKIMLPRLEHEWGDWITQTAADCIHEGVNIRVCRLCNAATSEIIPALGHDYQDVPVAEDPDYVAPSCYNKGVKHQACTRCGDKKAIEIPKLDIPFSITDLGCNTNADGHVDFVISGRCNGFDIDTKCAFGLENDITGEYLVGKRNPTSEDYTYSILYYPSDSEEEDTFVCVINLTDAISKSLVEDKTIGAFSVKFGMQDFYGYIEEFQSYKSSKNIVDNAYRYILKFDIWHFKLKIETIQPYFHLSGAELYTMKPNDVETVWVRIRGAAIDQTKTISELATMMSGVNPYISFINAQEQSHSPSEGEWWFEAYEEQGVKMIGLCINLQFMIEGSLTTYHTLLNMNSSSSGNGYIMENVFGSSMAVPNTNRTIAVFSNPNGEATSENAYGYLGFRVYVEE